VLVCIRCWGSVVAKGLKSKNLSEEEAQNGEVQKQEKKPVFRDIVVPEFEVSRIHNGQLEVLSLVRTVVDKGLQARLFPRFVDDHFASDVGSAIYSRLNSLHSAGKEWPSLVALSMDPALPAPAQQLLKSYVSRIEKTGELFRGTVPLGNGTEVPIESTADFEGFIFDLLEAYRITRKGTETYVTTVQQLGDDQAFDPLKGPALVEAAATSVLSLRGRESITDAIIHYGFGTTDEDERKRKVQAHKLSAAEKPRFKTGLTTYDQKAGGLQAGEVVLLGASTGSGKTAMQLTMMTNMGRMGTSCAMLQLELTQEQIHERLGANLANIDSELVRTGQLSPQDTVKIEEALAEFHEECAAAQARVTFYAPSAATVQECEFIFKQFKYSVWFIDYVNLIKLGGDSDGKRSGEDWTRLSDIVKEFKRIAKKYSIAIVLAVQVNIDKDTGDIEIRYAKAMKEHADVVLGWHLSEEARNEGSVWIRHLKARQYEPFDFPVRIALNFGRFESFSMQDLERQKERKLGGKKKIKKVEDVDEAAVFKKKNKPLSQEDPPKKGPHQESSTDQRDLDEGELPRQAGRRAIVLEDHDAYEGYDQ
jgi:hypothetical protein